MKFQKIKSDILIIGGGLAGLRSAIEAKSLGGDVLVVSKSDKKDPHSVLATGGINAALGTMDPEDNWKIHAIDTLKEGKFIGDSEMVETLCKNAPNVIKELSKWGVRFHKEKNGKLTQRFFGAHTYRRTCFFGDRTGKELVRAVFEKARKKKVKMIDDIYISKILTNKNGVYGALGIDFKKKRLFILQCKVVVLATGGFSRVYNPSSSRNFENFGEGVALAYESGAAIANMELVQFHPTGMIWPKKALGTLVTEAVRGEGGILTNSKGERFMSKYDPARMELGPRDEVAQSIWQELKKGNSTRHGGVWLDISHLSKSKILNRLPRMYKQFKDLVNVDISKQKMEVSPTAHYSMGGVSTDIKGHTNVRGLFAVGETTTHVHGANRLGGNSLLETLVFGKIVGREAVRLAKKRKYVSIKDHSEFGLCEVKNAQKFSDQIQKIMWNDAGIIRDSRSLKKGLSQINKLKNRFERNKKPTAKINGNVIKTLDVKSMLVISESIIKGAMKRKESRGAHMRSDFTRQNDKKFKINIYFIKNGKSMRIFSRKVKPVRSSLVPTLKKMKKDAKNHLLE